MTRGDDFVPQLISRRQRRNSAIEGKERLEVCFKILIFLSYKYKNNGNLIKQFFE